MSIIGVPVMRKDSFIHTERAIGDMWKKQLFDSMAEAGKEEKRLAEERSQYHEGVPAITVVVDGGWSKRSHKHSYNANSGVGIIIGKETGKLLHIGVRNKFCSACTRKIPRDKHVCWSQSSSEMETDIIWRGFWRQRGCMVSATYNLLVMATALCTQLSSKMFLDGAMPSKSSSVPIMHANATEVHFSASSRTTPPIRVVAA